MMGTLRPIAAALAAALLAGLLPRVGWATPGALSVTVRPAPSGALLTLSAPGPFRFSLRQLRGPDRLVVDLTGLDVAAVSGAQEVNLAPVRAVRVARGSGFVQVVIDLVGPVLADLDLAADGRRLSLRLQAVETTPPPPRQRGRHRRGRPQRLSGCSTSNRTRPRRTFRRCCRA